MAEAEEVQSLEHLTRRQLQLKAKEAGIAANAKSVDIIRALHMPKKKRKLTRRAQADLQRRPRRCTRRLASAKYQVGTSGFMLPKREWLELPCLNCIEINSTFYHLPQPSTIEKWKTLPPSVGVVIKASKFITHVKRLHDVQDSWELLWNRIKPLGSKLRCILVQLPPSFHYNEQNLERVRVMKDYIRISTPLAFEFRDISWFQPKVYDVFKKLRWCLVGTYILKQPGSRWLGTMPPGLLLPPRTSSISYLRVHGKRGYKGSLNQARLEEIRKALAAQRSVKTFVMFNNTFFDGSENSCDVGGLEIKYAAVCNAVSFTNMLSPA